jgi:hypothetical protein
VSAAGDWSAAQSSGQSRARGRATPADAGPESVRGREGRCPDDGRARKIAGDLIRSGRLPVRVWGRRFHHWLVELMDGWQPAAH